MFASNLWKTLHPKIKMLLSKLRYWFLMTIQQINWYPQSSIILGWVYMLHLFAILRRVSKTFGKNTHGFSKTGVFIVNSIWNTLLKSFNKFELIKKFVHFCPMHIYDFFYFTKTTPPPLPKKIKKCMNPASDAFQFSK